MTDKKHAADLIDYMYKETVMKSQGNPIEMPLFKNGDLYKGVEISHTVVHNNESNKRKELPAENKNFNQDNAISTRAIKGGALIKGINISPNMNSVKKSASLSNGIYIGTFESVAAKNFDALYYPAQSNGLCFLTTPTNKAKMHSALQSVIIKLLQELPSGLAKLNMYDPNGLGSNLIYLSQLDEKIKGENILTTTSELDRMLSKETAEIPNIIQKVLGHKYRDKSLVEYNEDAGELSKPFNLTVIADYPHSFSKENNQQLFQILESGKRAGFFTFLTLDTTFESRQINPLQIIGKIPCVYEHEGAFYVKGLPYDRYFYEFKFQLNTALPNNLDEIIEQLNKDTKKVKVASVSLMDKLTDQTFWSENGSDGIEVPIGKINISDPKDLILSIEDGVSDNPHHCLIGGATGSGKTVLLHNIICNTSWIYSPEEINFLLLDYKEGTEFKAYERLPHVKVLSIRSEREFGISVLKYLNEEIEKRGELFKAQNVSNLSKYNNKVTSKLPRIILIIDEFQKLFDGSSKIAKEAKNAMDDIGRRGRSFGINMILSTQSLSGIDINQVLSHVGLRITLKLNTQRDCDQLLGLGNHIPFSFTKKGEAIYNSRGGLSEGNSRLQVAYIKDEKMRSLVDEIRNRSDKKYGKLPFKQFIHDGSLKPKVGTNPNCDYDKVNPRVVTTYIGEALALKEEHVYTKLRKQNESNILIVGQDIESAVSIFKHTFIQTQRQSSGNSQFILFNKMNVDHELYDELDNIEGIKSFDADKQIEFQINTVFNEMQNRIEGADDKTRVLLGLFNIGDIRCLRKNGMMNSEMGQKLSQILLDGSGLNIYCMLYAYSHQSLSNTVDTLRGLSNFDTRIALKGGDSTKILNMGYEVNELNQDGIALHTSPFVTEVTKFKVYDI